MSARPGDQMQALTRRVGWALLALLVVYTIGIIGYKVIGGPKHSWVDAFYMTTITLTTTGYREVIDIAEHPAAMTFTIVLLLFGATTVVVTGSLITAYLIEGDLTEGFRRRRMHERIDALRDHVIVCGAGQTGTTVVRELLATGRGCVAIEADAVRAESFGAEHPAVPVLVGDCTDDQTLQRAGIARASGVVIATDDDKNALVTTVLARQLAPDDARIIARTPDERVGQRLRAAGADGTVSPAVIGGMRMASELVRPSVVTFLDLMLRDRERNLRIEEVPVGPQATMTGSTVGSLGLHAYGSGLLLLAVRGADGEYRFNPPASTEVTAAMRLIVMGDPASVRALADAAA